MDWRFIISLLLAIVVAVFAIQNAEAVNIAFFSLEISVSQALVILISAVAGAITVMFLSIVRWIRYKSQIKTLNRQINTLENENTMIKNKLERTVPRDIDETQEAVHTINTDPKIVSNKNHWTIPYMDFLTNKVIFLISSN